MNTTAAEHINADGLFRLLAGRITADERLELDAHLDSCPRCLDFIAAAAMATPGTSEPLASAPASISAPTFSPHPRSTKPRGALVAGRYTILELVGVGGMGVVYSATDAILQRRVALKVLRPDRAMALGGELAEARLTREARTLARLSHPNVIAVYDVGHTEDGVFVAMEFVQGRTVRTWLEQEPRPSRDQILEVFVAAGRGLAAAHAAGVIHRDFKPDNVLVGDDGRVRVTDFGLAVAPSWPGQPLAPTPPGPLAEALSSGGSVVAGTPRYMAPEQFTRGGADEKSDQFSFCVALHEAVFGAQPFPVDHVESRLAAIAAGSIALRPGDMPFPCWFGGSILRGLRAAPEARFPSMRALCDTLGGGDRRRSRALFWGVAVGVASVLVGVTTSPRLRAQAEGPGCTSGAAQIEQVWGEARRAKLRDAAAKSGSSAVRSVDRLAGEVDGYLSGWASAYDAACRSARNGAVAERAPATATLSCLDAALAKVSQVVAVAERVPDLSLAQNASAHAGFVAPETCAHVGREPPGDPMPLDASTRAEVFEIRVLYLTAVTHAVAGRYDEALTLAAAAVTASEKTTFEPVLAEALARLGNIQRLAGKLTLAQPTLERALAVAEGARHDALIAPIWLDLALVDTSLGRLSEAGRALDRVASFYSRFPPRPDVQAMMASKRALVLRALGRHREAIIDERESMNAPVDTTFSPKEQREASALTALGASYAALGDWDLALEHHRRALALREHYFGPQHARVAGSLNNIGEALAALGATDEARAHYQRANAMRETLLGPDHLEVSYTLQNLGALDRDLGDFEASRRALTRALTIRETILGPDHVQVADTLWELGQLALAEGAIKDAASLLTRARSILERTVGPAHSSTALVLVDLGRAELARSAPAEARTLLERAVKVLDPADVTPEQRAGARFALARALDEDGTDPARALGLARSAGDLVRSRGKVGERHVAVIDRWLEGRARR